MKDWQQTHDISMAIQTAEMRLSHADMAETFFATCNLINIARGQSIEPLHQCLMMLSVMLHQPKTQPVQAMIQALGR